jgi:hypothetical protein
MRFLLQSIAIGQGGGNANLPVLGAKDDNLIPSEPSAAENRCHSNALYLFIWLLTAPFFFLQ